MECTFVRPEKRRGPARRRLEGDTLARSAARSLEGTPAYASGDWTYEPIADPETIEKLVDVFHKVCYPILLYFHWPTFSRQVQLQLYRDDQDFFALTTAVCAMASVRLRDGAQFTPWVQGIDVSGIPAPELFYDAAVKSIPTGLGARTSFNFMRAKSILALICLQYGDSKGCAVHVGEYMTMAAQEGFNNESRWPTDLNEIDVQERRRFWWAAYQLDVYSSVMWGGVIRHRESQSTVLYPAEADDEDIFETGVIRASKRPSVSFMRGWNFTSDLYRIIEHAVERLRARTMYTAGDPTEPVSRLFSSTSGPSSGEIMAVVDKLYADLPPELQGAKAMTGDVKQDRFGFHAANIIITMQTLKMVMAGSERWSIPRRCAIADALLGALATVPAAYIQASSAPMLHHLAGVGHILGSVVQSPLSPWIYAQVRNVLLSMANLVASLEACLSSAVGVSVRLKAHISRIDQYMSEAAGRSSQRDPVTRDTLFGDTLGADNEGKAHVSSDPATHRDGITPTAITPRYIAHSGDIHLSDATSETLPPVNGILPTNGAPEQFQLPDSLFADWPFDVGQGDAFDFLWQGNQDPAGSGGSTTDMPDLGTMQWDFT